MDTKATLYRMAIQRITQHRYQAESLAEHNQLLLQQAEPNYDSLNKQLRTAQIEQARRSVLNGPDEALSARIVSLRQQLVVTVQQAGFTLQQLQPCYACEKCNDTGVYEGKRCLCVEQEMRRLRREQINREFPLEPSDFTNFSLDKYSEIYEAQLKGSPRSVMSQVLDYCQAFATHFRPGLGNVMMMGDAGLGKTHLALSVARHVLSKGYDVVYVSAQQAFARLDDTSWESEADAWREAMLEADLLIVDDLGTEYITPRTISNLYEIINTRMGGRRTTIYTTNVTSQSMMTTRYSEKLASRLLGGCTVLQFAGEDIRLEKNRV